MLKFGNVRHSKAILVLRGTNKMKRLLLAGVALMAMGAPIASAAYINGTVSFYPDAVVQGSGDTQTINFGAPGAEFLSAFISGDFLLLGPNSGFGMQNHSSTVPWQQFGTTSNLSAV